ncbi:MAG: beta-N-acetylhexosaminidase [Phycisphaerae bacterium]|nr:beta-N-acetylhexosaminidase [Phycisphaerae bacterium]
MNLGSRYVYLIVALAALLMTGPSLPAAQAPPLVLIPLPDRATLSDGTFLLGSETVIRVIESETDTARFLADAIARSTGVNVRVLTRSSPAPLDGAITLSLDAARGDLGEEGYTLEIAPKGAFITAAKSAGLFYGMQSLRQLLPLRPAEGRTEYPLACVRIEDTPRFGWRGFMLDSSRHFVSKATVLHLLDALAMFKINVFHWHLVDDNAWRLAIAKYPRLVQPAGIRGDTYTQAMGYYSAEDVGEIVERAKRLHITIVPEIEMPSHAMQVASVLSEGSCLGADGKPLPPGASREICLGSDKAIGQLQDILVETMALFPHSPYIHLGGDEAEDRHWKACSRCQARMAGLGITDPRLLQKWFMKRMNRFVREHGRTSVAWADRLSLGIPEGQIVHCWHAGELEEAVARGFRVIQSRHDCTYFDYGQGPGDTMFAGASLDMGRVYELDPVRGLAPQQAKLVLGSQAQLWTELVTDDRVFAKTFPRILALAEVGWTPQEKRDGAEFARRAEAFLPRLDALGIPYFKAPVQLGAWNPQDMSETWKDLDWDITTAVRKTGPLGVQMLYQRGAHALDIQSVVLLEDGHEISRDEHQGRTGAAHAANDYQLRVGAVKPGSIYRLRARIRSDGGTDSHGVILLR